MTKKLALFAGIATALLPVVGSTQQKVLEEVVVTAQRREQSLQEVPVSVTAFSGETLRQANITEAKDYLALTPNVSFTEDGQFGSRGMGISVRGINNLVSGENAFAPSIGVYMNGFSVASVPNQFPNPQLPDMERIEVLRGPQGTLFGRNAVGGALNMQTRRPTDEFEGEIIVGAQTFEDANEMFNVTAILNVPVTDTFKARGVVFYEDSGGLVENINPDGTEDSGHDEIMGRLALAWDLNDRTRADVTLMYSDYDQGHDENVPSGVWDIDTVDTFVLGVAPAFTSPPDPGTGFWPENRNRLSHDLKEKNQNESFVAIFDFTHEWRDDITLKWVTGIIDAENERLFDNDLLGTGDTGDFDTIIRTNNYEGFSWSTEFRMEMSKDRFDWILGVIYAEDEQEQDNNIQVSTNPLATFGGIGVFPPFPVGLCLQCNDKLYELESVAVFTDLTFHVTNTVDVTVGARYADEKVTNGLFDATNLELVFPAGGGPPIFPLTFNSFRPDVTNSESFTDLSPRFAVRWQAMEEVSLYGIVSKGYKAGGTSVGHNPDPVNVPLPATIAQPFDEEELWNYEIGVKSELFDRRVRLNASAFFLEWEDLQLEAFRFLVPGNLSSNFEQTVNIGEAQAIGFEVEFTALVTEHFAVWGAFGWLDTDIKSADTAELTGGFVVNLKNEDIPKAPKYTASLGGEYRFRVAENDAWVRVEYVHREGQCSDIEACTFEQTRGRFVPNQGANAFIPPAPDGFPFNTPDYDVVNLRAGYEWGQFNFNVFVENLFDEEYFTGTQENFGLTGIRLRPHPRIIGGSLGYRF